MRSKSVRLVISATVLATAAWTLTACSADKTSDTAASSPVASTGSSQTTTSNGDSSSAATGSSSTSTSTSGSTATSGSGAAATTTTKDAPAAAGKPCTSAQLDVSQQDASVGAGQFYAKIVFKNTASTSCTLSGYPGVSYVKAAGVQSGNPATRTGSSYHTVTLGAGGTASATMHDSNGQGGYSSGQCKLTSVKGLRIYPPNEKAALFLPDKTQHCAGTSIHPLSIGPVQS